MSEPSEEAKQAEWKIAPVAGKDGWNFEGLAYISDGTHEYGSLNKEQAIAICKAHNAATAKLREENERLTNELEQVKEIANLK